MSLFHINYVNFLTTPSETSEGLDKKLSLHYYSRLRFTQNLLPLLNKAASEPSSQAPARVISVLGAGLEGGLNTADLSLKSTYSTRNAANHATTMTTLAFHALAPANPGVTFIHSQPGGVQTNLARGLGTWSRFTLEKSMFLIRPWMVPLQESGERHLWAGRSERFAEGGVVLLGQDSGVKFNKKVDGMRKDGTEEKVWQHTEEVFGKVCKEGGMY
jgi:hypothetical protein